MASPRRALAAALALTALLLLPGCGEEMSENLKDSVNRAVDGLAQDVKDGLGAAIDGAAEKLDGSAQEASRRLQDILPWEEGENGEKTS